MKKQTAHQPKGKHTISDISTNLNSDVPPVDPQPKEAKIKSNDGGYIWLVS